MTTKGLPGNFSGNNGRQLAIPYDGSRPLKNNAHERYARFRAQALPRMVAFRKAGNIDKNDCNADANSFRLEKKPGVRERIEYFTRQAQDRIAEKRAAIEEQLWAVLEADIGDFWETYEAAKTKDGKAETDPEGKMLTVRKQRAKLINDLPPEFRKLIEDVTIDRHGNVIPKLYSKAQANKGLRELLNIGAHQEQQADDASRLSDAELIAQLAEQAKQLGVTVDLNFRFAQQPHDTQTDGSDGQVIDNDSGGDTAGVERSATEAASELTISALPPSSQRRQDALAGARKKTR